MDEGRIGRKPLVKCKVYVEGGGNTKVTRAACRKGFSEFFGRAGLKGRMPRVMPCGDRREAYDDFCEALGAAHDDEFVLLLVDSEEPVAEGSDPWSHLGNRAADRWSRPREAGDDSAQLMVQCMEAWFLADQDSLARFFGAGFNRSALPARSDVENVPKDDIEAGLKMATRRCGKKLTYHKGRHSFAILAELDPGKVTAASPHAKRLVDAIRGKALR